MAALGWLLAAMFAEPVRALDGYVIYTISLFAAGGAT